MKCAYLRIYHQTQSNLMSKWKKPKPSYSLLTLEDTYSFVLTAITLPLSMRPSRVGYYYKMIATRLKNEGVVYLITNETDPMIQDVFQKNFGFIFPTGKEILRILPFEILDCFLKQQNLSFLENNFGIYINRLDKYRTSFLSNAAVSIKHLTVFTDRKAAFSLYFDDLFSETGLSVPVRDLDEYQLEPDLWIFLDKPPEKKYRAGSLCLYDPDKLRISFLNTSLMPLLDGFFSSLGSKETEFLLHARKNRLFPHTSSDIFYSGFTISHIDVNV